MAEPTQSANDRLKSRFGSVVRRSIIVVAAVELAVLRFAPGIPADAANLMLRPSSEMRAVSPPSAVVIAEPPAQVQRRGTPMAAPADLAGDLTIPSAALQRNAVAGVGLPPPMAKLPMERLAEKPRWPPPSTRPRLLNQAEVTRAMAAAYPDRLCDAGIGGTILLVLYLDEHGSVERAKIRQSSGVEKLDDVALSVAKLYRFSPALTQEEQLPVSVVVTIKFRVRAPPHLAAGQGPGWNPPVELVRLDGERDRARRPPPRGTESGPMP